MPRARTARHPPEQNQAEQENHAGEVLVGMRHITAAVVWKWW